MVDDAVNNDIFFKFKNILGLNDELCLHNTGYKKDQFFYIYDFLLHYEDESKMRNTNERSLSQALAIYLYWLKTGLDQDSIANHFGTITRRQVSAYLFQNTWAHVI